MGAKFDDLKKFKEQLEELNENRDAFFEHCSKQLAARLLRKVVKRTPVGVKPEFDGPRTIKVKGASGKSKIFLTKEGAIYEEFWKTYTGGTLKRSWTVGPVEKTPQGYKIEVKNPTHYAVYVEFGHRQTPGRYVPALGKTLKKGWVPGRFMLTISEKEIVAMMGKYLERELKRLFRGAR